MYCAGIGLFARRMGSGQVCICQTKDGHYPGDDEENVVFSHILEPGQWKSLVEHLGCEDGRVFYDALTSQAKEDFRVREITTHKMPGRKDAIDTISVAAIDGIGPGGASHVYEIVVPNRGVTRLSFQKGAIHQHGVNGITDEGLLAILIDRIKGFQGGPFACDENQEILDHLLSASGAQKARTIERLDRGVEGTHVK